MLFAVAEVVLEVVALGLERVESLVASRPREFHPRPLSERCVNLSIHTAPIKQTRPPSLFSSVRTDGAASLPRIRGRGWPASCAPSGAGTSSSPRQPALG